MKLKDIKDVERYLKEDCYCPGEIYSFDGFFYQLFDAEDSCKLIAESDDKVVVVSPVEVPSEEKSYTVQIVVFYREGDKVVDALRMDATRNNLDLVVKYVNGTITSEERHKFDSYDPKKTADSIRQVLNMADAIIVD